MQMEHRLSVARGVARGLEYLHINKKSQRIVPHGNLKSSNVLLDEKEEVIVSDYGFASLVALPIATQRMMSYNSPEYREAKRVSKQSDVLELRLPSFRTTDWKGPSQNDPTGSQWGGSLQLGRASTQGRMDSRGI